MNQTSTIEIANTEMAEVWDGEEGDDWTENAERYDATDRLIAARFDAEVDISSTDHVLDVGCGTGKSTRTAARRAASGRVLGIDLSSRMLEYAKRAAARARLTNIEHVRGDAQVYPFAPCAFDLAISTFGAMFFADPVAALTNVNRSLRPGGRIAFLTWQRFEHNEWLTEIFGAVAAGSDLPVPAAGTPGPFGLADPDDIREILRAAGLADPTLTPLTEPIWLGADEEDAWSFVSGMGLVRGLTDRLDPPDRAAAFADLRRVLAEHATDDGVLFGSAAWLITAVAA